MKFERGKNIKDIIGIGRGINAVLIEDVYIQVQKFPTGKLLVKDPQLPSLGKYFRSDSMVEFSVGTLQAYNFLKLVLKQDLDQLRNRLEPILKNYETNETVLFAILFRKKIPSDNFNTRLSDKIFYMELYDCDIRIVDDILHIPNGRLIKNSDFQIHLNGTRDSSS